MLKLLKMLNFKDYFLLFILTAAGIGVYINILDRQREGAHLVAIANWGPHNSLEESIQGLKAELTRQGFIEGEKIHYEIADVGFDPSLIGQMITKLKSSNPKVMVVLGTPVAQSAKNLVKDIPLVFGDITDPVEAGLVKKANKAAGNMSGASDKQDLNILLDFAKKLIPHAHTVGVLYSTAEANDAALVKMLEAAAEKAQMQVIAVPVDQARDVPMRMQAFKDKVDFIYVGVSGPIQPTLPAIVAAADKMKIPVFNADSEAVQKHQVLASFGVDYRRVGRNMGRIVGYLLNRGHISDVGPMYPTASEHHGFISKKKAESLDIPLPASLDNVTIVE